MHRLKLTPLAATCVLALACGRGDEDFTDATPDMDGLAMEISDQAAEGVTTNGLQAGTSSGGLTAGPEFLRNARDAVVRLNGMLRKAIAPVVGLISKGGRIEPGAVRFYGPRDQDGATWRLYIKRINLITFAWRLDAKPIGADDTTYLTIMGGAVQRGAEAHRGRGLVGVNLDNLAIVLADGGTFHGQGKLLAAFAHVESDTGERQAKALAYILSNFTPDSTVHEPVSAAFVGHKLFPSGATGIRLLAQANLEATATDLKEVVALRARWIPGIGGAAAVRAAGGDIPVGTWYRGFACWDATEQEGYKIVQSCTGDRTTCTTLAGYPVGDPLNCQTNLRDADLPPPEDADRDSSALEAGAPMLADPLAPPVVVPDGETAP